MYNIIANFLIDGSQFIGIIILPLSIYFIKSILPKLIDERIQGKIEEIKLQNRKAQYRYELYTQKQHEVFLELYYLFGEAKGMIAAMSGLYTVPDFKGYSVHEFEEWYSRQAFKMLDIEKVKIITLLQVGDYKAVNELTARFIENNDYQMACRKLIDSNNYFLKNKLYIPEIACENISDLYSSLNKFCCLYCDPKKKFKLRDDSDINKQVELREHINNCYSKMTQDFKTYMENGD